MLRDSPGGPGVKNLPSNAGDVGPIPVWETSESHLLQGNCMARLYKPENHSENQHSPQKIKIDFKKQ